MSAQDFYNEASKDPSNTGNRPYNNNSTSNLGQLNNSDGTQDRGLMSTVIGGAGGYYAGSKISNNNSKLSGILGAVGGAFLANKVSDKFEHNNGNNHSHHQQQYNNNNNNGNINAGYGQYGRPGMNPPPPPRNDYNNNNNNNNHHHHHNNNQPPFPPQGSQGFGFRDNNNNNNPEPRFRDHNPGRFQGDPRFDDRQEYMDNNQQFYYNQGPPPPGNGPRW